MGGDCGVSFIHSLGFFRRNSNGDLLVIISYRNIIIRNQCQGILRFVIPRRRPISAIRVGGVVFFWRYSSGQCSANQIGFIDFNSTIFKFNILRKLRPDS
jgi:hypothetical protein